MPNVHTLKDISSGHQLGSAREMELEEALRISSKSVSEFTNKYNDLLGTYFSNFEKRFNKEKAKLHHNLEQADTNNGKLSERIHKLTSEITQLRSEKDSLNSQVIHKGASLAESKDKVATKSKEIKVLQSKLKTLEKNHSLAHLKWIPSGVRIELEQAKEDLSSKKYELECMEKGAIACINRC